MPTPPFYDSLQKHLEERGDLQKLTPQAVRDAVIAIRQSKLPDPAKVANCGSFFSNPIISETRATKLLEQFPHMPHWVVGDGDVKIPAAWLLERVGFKNYHDVDTGMATWPTQSLVLVNERAKDAGDLLVFRQKILDAVQEQFGISLEQEPELLP